MGKEKTVKTFKRWCEDNGRNWMGAATYEEFVKNAKDYEKYRERGKLRLGYS
jgi:hypothetical protein